MGIFGEASVVSIAGFILTVVSFIIHLIGFASPFWSYASISGVKVSLGLWQVCVTKDEQTICLSLSCGMFIYNNW